MREEIGVFGAELEVEPDRVAKFLSENSCMIMLGMGAGKYADAQYLLTEVVCGYCQNQRPRDVTLSRSTGNHLARSLTNANLTCLNRRRTL